MGFDAGVLFRFPIGALPAWRLPFLLVLERGRWDVFARSRRAPRVGVFGGVLRCVKCVGLWIVIPFALVVGGGWVQLPVVLLVLAGVSTVIDELTRPPFELREPGLDESLPTKLEERR